MALAVLAALYLGLGWTSGTTPEVRAVVFCGLVGTVTALVLANRSYSAALVKSLKRPNPALWGVVAASLGLLGLALAVPGLRTIFGFVLPPSSWLALAGLASAALLPLLGWIVRRRA